MLSLKGTAIGGAIEQDGGHSRGGEPKSGCGGYGKEADATGQFFTGKLAKYNAQQMSSFGKLRANIGELSGLRMQHSGIVIGGGDWPKCTDKRAYISLGKIASGFAGRYIKLWIYGSHRGYHRDHYMEVHHHVITCGDKCSSFNMYHRGRKQTSMYNSFKNEDRYEYSLPSIFREKIC